MTVFKVLPKEDNEFVYSLADFVQMCMHGEVIDYDGHGYFALQTMQGGFVESDIKIYPLGLLSMAVKDLPTWATHIVWYNK